MWYSAVGFLVTLTLRMLVAPCAAAPPARIPTIGWLEQGGRADKAHLQAVFLQGLREFGYVEGQNLAMVHRDAEGHLDRLPALTAELVQLPVDVIVTTGGGCQRLAQPCRRPRSSPSS
jgi:putative ABC transport system substrate-binding protein